MITRLFTTLLLTSGLLLAASTTLADDIRSKRVHFPKGEIGTTIKDHIKGDETIDYKLGAHAGQRMAVSLDTDNTANYFNVLAPGEENVAFFIGSNEGNHFEGNLPESGDYTVRIYLMRSAARRGESANYSLEIAIAAADDVPSEADR